jgi:enoyl-CoA hydratase/carnithine racemase
MLLHCDLIYAGDNARFALPFTHLGLRPEAGATLLLPARLGGPRAAALLLLGEPFSAEQALAWGLVNAVLPAADALAHAHSRATALAALPPEALRATKRLMRQATAPFLAATLADEAATFCHLLAQPAAQAALSAHLTRDAGRGRT